VRKSKIHIDLPGHQDEVYAVDWAPDGQRVGSGGKDKVFDSSVSSWFYANSETGC
jgi:WD40 repeat protein